ncbi:MAG TPA: hypothetical protein VGO00_17395, partial [Kofleriaceae bacterium]|nr:hypothetical protein [Kofleriaceae bacterium]
AEIDAAPLCPEGKSEQIQSILAYADTTIIDDGNAQPHGDTPEVLLKRGPFQIGLWKFGVANAFETAVDAELVLPYILRELDCPQSGGMVCVSCDSDEVSGPITIYPLISTWDEMSANWNCRVGGGTNGCPGTPGLGIRWDQPGASGTDRGPAVATAQHVAASDTHIPLGTQLGVLRDWVDTGTLSMTAVAGDATRAWVPAQTTEPSHVACRPPGVARIEVTYCE